MYSSCSKVEFGLGFSAGRIRMDLKYVVTFKSVEFYLKLFTQHYINDLDPSLLTT